ncbi:MAG: toprim domain-containing protein [Pirellulaceae bacterium]
MGRWPGDDYDAKKGRPRYRWPDGFSKSQIVYGLSFALETPADRPLIVVESPFSVFHLHQVGLPNTVSIFGSSLSDEQADILICTDRPLILMFDGDEAGFKGMRTAAAKLIRHAYVCVNELPEGRQPDELERSEIADLLR